MTADVEPTISALQRRGDEICDHLLRANESRWESLSGADRERLEEAVRAVASRLLREPVLRLEASQGEKTFQYTRALGELFGLSASRSPCRGRDEERPIAYTRAGMHFVAR